MRNDEIANFHKIREDILPPEKNTLIMSEKERIFENFVESYEHGEIPLKIKILRELKTFFRDPIKANYAL